LIAQSPSTPLTGVWRVTEVVRTGADPINRAKPQPGLFIFTGNHYSIMTLNTDEPRKPLPALQTPGKPTDAEIRAMAEHWNPFTANAGTYAVKGNTFTTRPLVAKNQGVMDGPGFTFEFKLDGKTLTITQRSAAGQPQAVTTTKLTRVE
jgi:hypothetical protein